MLKFLLRRFILVASIASLPLVSEAITVYENQAEFLDRAFNKAPPEPAVTWLSGDRKARVRELLGHDYPALRLRYWCKIDRSAWVLEEIGKEQPITVGIIIERGVIRSLKVLTYRENRGGEVASASFTEQFHQASLNDEGKLDTSIDGISGATLSVQALTRLAGVALYLHDDSGCGNDA